MRIINLMVSIVALLTLLSFAPETPIKIEDDDAPPPPPSSIPELEDLDDDDFPSWMK